MLKSTTSSPKLPMWHLMMKNVYSLGGYQIQKAKFKLNIKYLSDTTGTQINYLPVPGLNNQSLLQVMNLDRIDSNEQSNPDGFFDFIDGYTIYPSTGKVVFPVVEPFGSHLAMKIGNEALAQKYVYQELYDSTLVVARQYADKNKFMLTGEYQASAGSQIRLNAMNVPRGSVVVMVSGVRLTENTDYTVDYAMGIVTITNQSIIDSGQNISVTLENQSLFSTQRKTLLGLDLQYKLNKNLNIGATILHFSEKALIEKVNIGDETVNNSMLGFNLAYNGEFMWLTNLLNKIPTVNATQPSRLSLTAEVAKLLPHAQKSGSNKGSSYIDDFESTQTGIDLRSPYSWFLASTPYDGGSDPLFPEAFPQQQSRLRQEPRPAQLVLYRPPVHTAELVDVPRIYQKRPQATVEPLCARSHRAGGIPRPRADLWRIVHYPDSQPVVLPRRTRPLQPRQLRHRRARTAAESREALGRHHAPNG